MKEARAESAGAGLKGKLLRNVFSNWVSYAINIIIGFFLSPFLVHSLGDTNYGIWTLIASLTGYLGLLDLGVRGAVTQYVARFHAEAAHEKSSRVASTALAMFATAGTLAIALAVTISVFVDDIFRIPPGQRTTAQFLLILGGANVAASLISGVFGGITVGLQRFDLQNILEVTVSIVRALAIVLVLMMGHGLIALASVQLVCSIAGGLADVWLSFRLYPELRAGFGLPDREHARLIFSFSLFSFLIQVGGRLIYQTDKLVVGAFLPVSLVTYYAIGGSLVDYARGALSGVGTTITPAASALDSQGEKQALESLLLNAARFMMMVALPIGVAFLFRGRTFIGLWMGPQFAEPSSRVLQILAVSMLFTAATHPALSLVLGIRKHHGVVPAMVIEGILNLTLSIALVRRMGIVGVAWGTVIPSVIRDVAFWPWYLKRVLGISPWKFVTTGWIRPALGILPYALVSFLMDRYWPATNLLLFFIQVGLALPAALLPLWYASFTAPQRSSHWQFVTGMLRAGRTST